MDIAKAKKMSFMVNSVLFMLVIFMAGFFWYVKATFLVYFSIPTIMVYIIGYFLIHNNKLDIYIWLVYLWILLYMSLTTIGLGYNMGFHLYSMSLIPVIFCTEYLSHQLNREGVKAVLISIGIALINMACTSVVVENGPMYQVDTLLCNIMLIINASIVFGFLIIYSKLLVSMVINSEDKLKKMALVDRLTGLYNRHFMIDKLDTYKKNADKKDWLAMIDIDNFKKINDKYGHNCGDYVLVHLGEVLTEVCEGCNVSRWGGEEFLVMCEGNKVDMKIMENLRKHVAEEKFEYEGQNVPVTITIGVAGYQSNRTIDAWIQEADGKLYEGKNSGKNKVVY